MKFGVSKTRYDSNLPVARKDLILVYTDDILSMPVTNERGILAATDVILKIGALSYNLYLTSDQQKYASEIDGDLDVKGWIPRISGSFPGTALSISEWMHNNINKSFIAVQRSCGKGYSKIYGHPYNPLYLTGKISEDKDSSSCEITLAAVKKTKRPYLFYNAPVSNILSGDGSDENIGYNGVLLIDII